MSKRTKHTKRITDPNEYYELPKEHLLLYLTQQQKVFCYEYIKDFQVYKAYRRAGYKSKNRAPATRVRSLPQVDAMIELLMQEKLAEIDVEASQVLRELKYIGFSDLSDYCVWKNRGIVLKRSDQLTYEQTKAIQSIQETKTGIKITLHSKLNALRMMGEYLNMFSSDDSSKSPRHIAEQIKSAFDELNKSVPMEPPKETA